MHLNTKIKSDFLTKLPLLGLRGKGNLVIQFAFINFKTKYKGTYLGFIWNVLEPILTFLLLYFVFTQIRDRADDFSIYLLTGLMLFHIFTRGTMSGLSSIRSNSGLVTSFNFPREFFPAVNLGSIALTAIVEMIILVSLLPLFGFTPHWTLIFLPVVVALMLLLVLGLSYILSIMFVFVKDIQPVWGVIAHALFFISPIFWYVEEVGDFLIFSLKVNPVGQILELGHQVVVFGNVPPLFDWLYTASFVVVILFLGFGVFKKYEKTIAEEL